MDGPGPGPRAGLPGIESLTVSTPKKLADSNPGHMHRGHDLCNISLKFVWEA